MWIKKFMPLQILTQTEKTTKRQQPFTSYICERISLHKINFYQFNIIQSHNRQNSRLFHAQ